MKTNFSNTKMGAAALFVASLMFSANTMAESNLVANTNPTTLQKSTDKSLDIEEVKKLIGILTTKDNVDRILHTTPTNQIVKEELGYEVNKDFHVISTNSVSTDDPKLGELIRETLDLDKSCTSRSTSTGNGQNQRAVSVWYNEGKYVLSYIEMKKKQKTVTFEASIEGVVHSELKSEEEVREYVEKIGFKNPVFKTTSKSVEQNGVKKTEIKMNVTK